jgi:hypothetical protein
MVMHLLRPFQLIDAGGIVILAKAQPILARAFSWHGGRSRIFREMADWWYLGQETGIPVTPFVQFQRHGSPDVTFALAL